jgi:Putative Flp pilus-assembly TadE/G-like
MRTDSVRADLNRLAGSLSRAFKRLRREQSGSALALFAFSLPAMLGLTAIGVETGLWYVSKRAIQTQADAGALAGAFATVWGGSKTEVKAASLREAQRNGYDGGAAEKIVTNTPPASGPFAGADRAVEVMIYRQHNTLLFSAVVSDDSLTVSTRAVAGPVPTGKACILALDRHLTRALTNIGNTSVDAPHCAMASNSDDDQAAYFSGSSTVNVQTVWTAGEVVVQGGKAQLTTATPPTPKAWPLEDPYAGTPTDLPPGSCLSGAWNSGTKSPGKYCNGITVNSSAVVNLTPGTYYIDKGDFHVNGGAQVTCSTCTPGDKGVTFVLTSSGTAAQIGTVYINGTAKVVLNAPAAGSGTAGPGDIYAGLLFYQDPRAITDSTKTAYLNGNANTELVGATYVPSNQVVLNGNVSGASECTVIVANTVGLSGSSVLSADKCDEYKIESPVTTKIALLE